jgi:hypothetical protein
LVFRTTKIRRWADTRGVIRTRAAHPATGMLGEQAHNIAERHLTSVKRTTPLEGVSNPKPRASMRGAFVEDQQNHVDAELKTWKP